MVCFIRKNHLTINEDREVFEIADEDGNPRTWGSEEKITQLLGSNNWETSDWVTYKNGKYQLENTQQ